jgi:hypothetical protein
MPKSKPGAKPKKKLSVKEQFEYMRLAQIRHCLSLPPEKRTNFLRVRVGSNGSAL